jgi:hypothetical protein
MPNPNKTNKNIFKFLKLQKGWRYGEGIPPSENTVSKAILINEVMKQAGYPKTNASPGVGGQIQVNGYYDNIHLEFDIDTDGSISLVVEENNEEIAEETDLSVGDAIAEINSRGKQWISSNSSMTMISMPMKIDSTAQHLTDQVTIEVSQSLMWTVLEPKVIPSANTLPFTTLQNEENPSFTGKSQEIAYLESPI